MGYLSDAVDVLFPSLEHWKAETDGPLTEDAFRKKIECRGYRVVRCIYPRGMFSTGYIHQADTIDAVLSGRLRIVVEGKEYLLEAGDCIAVLRGTVHRAEVLRSEPVVSLDAQRG